LSYEQTQHLASLLDGHDLAQALEEFIVEYGYDESDDDNDLRYETVEVSYTHRASFWKEEVTA
jgi:hypothetical protein